MNTIVIPAAILALTHDAAVLDRPVRSVADVGLLFAGGALLALGAALAVHAIWEFLTAGEGTLAPWDPTRRMLTGGAYRHTRNPLKIGLFLILLGEAAVLRSAALLVWFALFALVNVVYIRVSEEPGLRRRFGAAYDDYCRRVPRWLPAPNRVRARSRREGGAA